MTDIVERLHRVATHGDQAEAIATMEASAAEIERLRAALRPFAEIARRLKWADLDPDDPLRDGHVMEAPAEDIAPGAAFCLFVGAFQDAARAVGEASR